MNMKDNKSKINLKNIHAFFQGESRILLDIFNSLPPYIKEQVEYRVKLVGEKSPECLKEKKCIQCKCSIPDLFYADKQCDGLCYPEMMNEQDWENFKQTNYDRI